MWEKILYVVLFGTAALLWGGAIVVISHFVIKYW